MESYSLGFWSIFLNILDWWLHITVYNDDITRQRRDDGDSLDSLDMIYQPSLEAVCEIVMTFKLLIHTDRHKYLPVLFYVPQYKFPNIILCP